MIRFIIKRRQDNSYDCVSSHFETIDADCPALEQALMRGGKNVGGPGYDISELIGVEVLPKEQPAPLLGQFLAAAEGAGVTHLALRNCAAGRDGDCTHIQCPQLRDGEPKATGRHCPLDA